MGRKVTNWVVAGIAARAPGAGQPALNLGLGRGQIAGLCLAQEIGLRVVAIAEGLVFGEAAAAQAENRPSAQTEFISLLIAKLKIALDAERSIVAYRDLRRHSESSFGNFDLQPTHL